MIAGRDTSTRWGFTLTKLSREIAEASRADKDARHASTTHTDVLVATAKMLERLQSKRRKLRKALKQIEGDIRLTKREVKALARQIASGKDEEL